MTDMYSAISYESLAHGENRDCAVRAVALATGKAYGEVLHIFSLYGRRRGRCTPFWIIHKVVEHFGYELVDVTDRFPAAKTPTSAERVLPQQRGVFLIHTRGHIACYRGGTVHDWTKGRRHRIKQILKLKRKQS